MAIELINIGRIANDGTGDDLREAFSKVNRNLEELDIRIDDKTEGLNVGSGIGQVFRRRDGYNLEFKSINGSNGLTIVNNETSLTLSLDTSIADLNVAGNTGAYTHPQGQVFTIRGGDGITTTARSQDNSVTIDYTGLGVIADANPTLSADLQANGNSIQNVNSIVATNVQSLVHGIDIRTLGNILVAFDFGDLTSVTNVTNFFDYIKLNVDVDMGTITDADSAIIDLGTIA